MPTQPGCSPSPDQQALSGYFSCGWQTRSVARACVHDMSLLQTSIPKALWRAATHLAPDLWHTNQCAYMHTLYMAQAYAWRVAMCSFCSRHSCFLLHVACRLIVALCWHRHHTVCSWGASSCGFMHTRQTSLTGAVSVVFGLRMLSRAHVRAFKPCLLVL